MFRLDVIVWHHHAAVSHSVRTDKLLDAGNLLGQFKPHIVTLCSANRYFKTLRVQSLYWAQPPHSEPSESETEKKTKGVSVPLWYSTAETVGHARAGVMWAVAFICQEKKKRVRKSEREQRQSTVLWKWRLIQIQWKEGGGVRIKWSSISPPLFSCSLPLSSLPRTPGVVGG